MNVYPALRARMGSWTYYVLKMRMKEVAADVRFASEIYEDRTLDDAIQRELNEGRVKRELTSYLIRQPDRFFAALVVAAIGGNPTFYPIDIASDTRFTMFRDAQRFGNTFGMLSFNGDQKYYALDGQHRLKAIKTLLDTNDPLSRKAPADFENEEISVIVVMRQEQTLSQFLVSYRRLFSSLNRYAKATDADTNIIMDEDDTFAILTRRLIADHPFFRWTRRTDVPRVKTKGKNLRTKDPYFTTLQTLYSVNETLLSASYRRKDGWGLEGEEAPIDVFKRFRPSSEEYIDGLHSELKLYWDAILETLPVLRREAARHRAHDADSADEIGLQDNLLFWPIGQELLAEIARALLDRRQDRASVVAPTLQSATRALRPLRGIPWDLHSPRWRHFLLEGTRSSGWRMRSEDRADALRVAGSLVRWLSGLEQLEPRQLTELRNEWQRRLMPAQRNATVEKMWNEVEAAVQVTGGD